MFELLGVLRIGRHQRIEVAGIVSVELLLHDGFGRLVVQSAHFHASRHMSGYQRPSSISIRSKSVMTLPSFLKPYALIMSGMNPSVSSSRQPRLLMKLL